MSLSVKTIEVGGQAYTLRLTSKALLSFNLKHGIEGNTPTIAVLGAVSDMAARVDLLTNALMHPENKNSVKDGGTLLDLMADDPQWDRDRTNGLILELAAEAGLIDAGEAAELQEAVATNDRNTISILKDMLTGKPRKQVGEPDTADEEENPT